MQTFFRSCTAVVTTYVRSYIASPSPVISLRAVGAWNCLLPPSPPNPPFPIPELELEERRRERSESGGDRRGWRGKGGGAFKKGESGRNPSFPSSSSLSLSLSPVSKAVPAVPIPRRRDELFVPCYCIMRTYYSICISTDYGAVITFTNSSSKEATFLCE